MVYVYKSNLSGGERQLGRNWNPHEMPDVGDGGELGEDASVAGVDSGKADIADGLQTPVELGPLVVGESGGAVAEQPGVES